MTDVRPVEIPSDPQNFDLDSFLDSLPGHLRMKIVQEKFGEPKATVTPIHRAEPVARQTAVGPTRTAEPLTGAPRVLLALFLVPLLLSCALVVLAAKVAEPLMNTLLKIAKERLRAT